MRDAEHDARLRAPPLRRLGELEDSNWQKTLTSMGEAKDGGGLVASFERSPLENLKTDWALDLELETPQETLNCMGDESPRWESEGEAWLEDESVSSTASRRGNMCNDALHVVGLHGLGDKISLFLQDWELAKVALSYGPGHAVPGNARGQVDVWLPGESLC